MNANLREFTNDDWARFKGCSSFIGAAPNSPLVADDVPVTGLGVFKTASVIVDHDGVSVYLARDLGPGVGHVETFLTRTVYESRVDLITIAGELLLSAPISAERLRAQGYVDHVGDDPEPALAQFQIGPQPTDFFDEPEEATRPVLQVNPGIDLRDFTKTDWYGLAGASRFDDGSEPLVAYGAPAEAPGDVKSAVVIVDREGIQVLFVDEEGEDQATRTLSFKTPGDQPGHLDLRPDRFRRPVSRDLLILIAKALPSPLTPEALDKLGFEGN